MLPKRPSLPFLGLLCSLLITSSVTAVDWQPLRVPGYWEKRYGGIVDEYNGYAWYRCVIHIPADLKPAAADATITLNLGQIDDCDETYFNGVKVGQSGTREPYRTASEETRLYQVAAKDVRFGEPNLIAVRVFDGGGAGGIAGGMPHLKIGRTHFNLAGTWQIILADGPAHANWPGDSVDSDAGKAFLAAFAKIAGPDFGKPIDMSPLPGTKPLEMEGDIASQLVAGVDKFLLRKLDESRTHRSRHWKIDYSSAEAYSKSIEPNRKRLAHMLGVRDARVKFNGPELVGTLDRPALVGKGEGYEIYTVRWPVLEDPDPNRSKVTIHGEGLLLVPSGGKKPVADVVAIPDCEQTPEQIVGLTEGVPVESQFARRLAESGCRVIVPVLINRQERIAKLTNREYLYRSSFELGRHLIGYELQKVLACIDWFDAEHRVAVAGAGGDRKPRKRIGVIGYGEGAMLAHYAALLDPRIDVLASAGFMGTLESLWQQPIDRNVFGLLNEFGDKELIVALGHMDFIHVHVSRYPEATLPGGRGAPAVLKTPDTKAVYDTLNAAVDSMERRYCGVHVVRNPEGKPPENPFLGDDWLRQIAHVGWKGEDTVILKDAMLPTPTHKPDLAARHKRQFDEIDLHTQLLLRESPFVRNAFMKKLYDAASTKNIDAYDKVAEEYRTIFKNDVIGAFDDPLLPANARTRKIAESDKWTQYEVVLDVWQDVIAYGILVLPKGIKDGDKRPVVVCQHGLEGRPQSVIGKQDFQYYKAYATELAERDFITFAPQNLYIFTDRFRTLQRKANPLGKTLFSIIVPQHQQITDWLKTLPQVDGNRIGFYGLSYGGKSAMRIPPLVKNYALSICSADFNEWVDKNASTRDNYSYVWTGEYEIFEWDLGSTFNYAEMAALIAPRPFMVERGHFDGVGTDERVAFEYAKVRHLYQARLGIGDRTEIEWFVGPHSINGVGTYEFLHKWLKHPKP